MDFEVFCDESRPEVLSSPEEGNRFLMIGSLWAPAHLREDLKTRVYELREKWDTWGEIKWSRVSPSRIGFYESLTDLFLSYESELRFRCIAVDAGEVDMELLQNDAELGFYKFYYQLIHHWITDFNNYRIFCDTKTNRETDRVKVLKRCLDHSNLTSSINSIQALPSRELVPMQLTDLLLGMVGARFNNSIEKDSAKNKLIERFETLLGKNLKFSTGKNEVKFNIFRIHLGGGW